MIILSFKILIPLFIVGWVLLPIVFGRKVITWKKPVTDEPEEDHTDHDNAVWAYHEAIEGLKQAQSRMEEADKLSRLEKKEAEESLQEAEALVEKIRDTNKDFIKENVDA